MNKIIGIVLCLLTLFPAANVSFAAQNSSNNQSLNSNHYLGNTTYGWVEKEYYGNQSSKKTVALIVGVHPQENGIHTAVAKNLATKSSKLTKKYVIYKVHVTKNADDYNKGRMNGQLLAQKFIVPDVAKEKPMLVIDNHENHYLQSGYAYSRFLYPVSNTTVTTTYANKITNKMPFLRIYTPPNHTSPQYVTIPIANKGIPTIIYETYMYDSTSKKNSDASTLINTLDKL